MAPSQTASVNFVLVGMLVLVALVALAALITRTQSRPYVLGTLGFASAVFVLAVMAVFAINGGPSEMGMRYVHPLGDNLTPEITHDRPVIVLDLPAHPPLAPPDTQSASSANPVTAPKTPLRPDWVDQPASIKGTTYNLVVTSDPKLTLPECQRDLELKVRDAINQYTDALLGTNASHRVPIDSATQTRLIQASYVDTVDSSVGQMQRLHVLLAFDEPHRSMLHDRLQTVTTKGNLLRLGSVSLIVLALLGTVFGYLKLDTATKGYYSRRLQLVALVLILGIAWAAFAAVRRGVQLL